MRPCLIASPPGRGSAMRGPAGRPDALIRSGARRPTGDQPSVSTVAEPPGHPRIGFDRHDRAMAGSPQLVTIKRCSRGNWLCFARFILPLVPAVTGRYQTILAGRLALFCTIFRPAESPRVRRPRHLLIPQPSVRTVLEVGQAFQPDSRSPIVHAPCGKARPAEKVRCPTPHSSPMPAARGWFALRIRIVKDPGAQCAL